MGLRRTALLVVALSVLVGVFLKRDIFVLVADTSNGYAAKVACSLVFVANRTLQSALDAELTFPPVRFLSSLTAENKCVTASWRFWPQTRTACWKSKELGCSLAFEGNAPPSLPSLPVPSSHWPTKEEAWPRGDVLELQAVSKAKEGVQMEELARAVQSHFNDTRLHARAVLVVRKGQIIYEQYGDETSVDTPLLGWSVTKSLINALVGILVREGKMSLDSRMKFEEWANDDRSSLTVREMLQMSDGLDFDELYHPTKDAPTMLFTTPHTSDTILPRKLRVQRNEERCFSYSSAATNLLCRLIRQKLQSEYLGFPERALFRPLGMRQATLETDAGGTFVGSSFGWASARDWTRFGLLYANDGVWSDANGVSTRILPQGWVNFSSTPTVTSDNVYGAHFWLGGRQPETNRSRIEHCNEVYPSRSEPPRDWVRSAFPLGSFFAHGFEEQVIAIVPSKDVVLIRFGSTKEVVLQWQKPEFYASVLRTIPDV